MYSQRILRGSPVTLSVTFTGDETPIDPDGNAVTVTVKNLAGGTIASGSATRTGAGTYTFNLAAQSALNVLTIEWVGTFSGSPATVTTSAEVVGGTYFTLYELRNYDPVLTNTTRYPSAKLAKARELVESKFEKTCGRAFVPRYAREVFAADGSRLYWRHYGQPSREIFLSNPEPLRPISLTVDGVDWSDKVLTRDSDNLRVLRLPIGDYFSPYSEVIIEYEYGRDVVPTDVREAALKLSKYLLVADQSRIDERATAMTIPDFGTFAMATPGMRGSFTGIPEVDIVLSDYQIGRT